MAAALPEQKLQQPLGVTKIEVAGSVIGFGQDRGAKHGNRSVGLLQGNAERDTFPRLPNGLGKGPVP